MKKSRIAVAIILAVVVLCQPFVLAVPSFEGVGIASADEWYYPLLPGDTGWADLTIEETYAICEMPEELLKVCSTDRLAELALDYPFALDVWMFNDAAEGLACLEGRSNILREFFSRPDAADWIIEKFGENSVKYELLEDKTLYGKKRVLAESGYSRDLFAQIYLGVHYEDLDEEQVFKLSGILEKKAEEQIAADKLSYFSVVIYDEVQKAMGFIPANLVPDSLYDAAATDEMTRINSSYRFNGSGNLQDVPATLLFNHNSSLYGDITIEHGEITHAAYGNRTVSCRKTWTEFSDGIIDTLNGDYAVLYPTLTYISTSTAKYNCHSYAWVAQTTTNVYWVNNPDSFYCNNNKIFDNSQYVTYVGHANKTTNSTTLQGDKIVFRNSNNEPVHSVVVHVGGSSHATTTTWAKMGIYGLYSGTLGQMLTVYYGSTASYDIYRMVH